jgi:thioredoxin-dependent peroxiredoxin
MSTAEHAATPSKQGPVQVGDTAPDFTLADQNGTSVTLHDVIGKGPVVVYFYPKDETSGCTAEACSFRDNYEVFQAAGAQVIGISGDSSESHRKFAEHHRLPFTLLSDTGNRVRRLYGVPTTMGIIPGRVTYILDRLGVVRGIFNSQSGVTRHVVEALAVIEQLQKEEQQA